MRPTLAFVLLAALGCGAAPLATCGAPGVVVGCPCVGGGSGVQECSPGGAWTACVCPAAPDAGADAATPDAAPPPPLDAPQEPEAPAPDMVAESGEDAGEDAAEDAAPEASAPDVVAEVAAPPDAGCPVRFADCDGDPSNGCETNVRESLAHCGACGASCVRAHAVTTCASGVCVRARCEAGFADCDADGANGCEVALVTEANCGGCGRGCTMDRRCDDAGHCVPR